MKTNLRGLVGRLELSASRGMLPLFEAISNAIDAIGERGIKTSEGSIRIRLIEAQDLVRQSGDTALVVDGFEISDNGIGFDDRRLASFEEAYTLAKVTAGGKGVGRFTFLKIFSSVQVRSVFEREEKRYARSFNFSVDNEVDGAENLAPTNNPVGTNITMRTIDQKYRSAWPRDIETIAERIITHFLIHFAGRTCPSIHLETQGTPPINLIDFFQTTMHPHIQEKSFEIDGHIFSLQAFRHRDGRSRHDYILCANGREVIKAKLKDLLPELPDKFVNESQETYTLIALITGEYLDDHANQERTRVAFMEDDDELAIDTALLPRQSLNKAIASNLRSVLAVDLKTTNEEKIAQIERLVEKAPEYRMLMHEKYRLILEEKIAPGLSEDKLDEVLLHIRRDIEDGARKEEKNIVALIEKGSFEQYQERLKKIIETMNDVGKSKLADYVAHRRIILDLIEVSLKRVQQDTSYPLEKVLHNMIFPMGQTSKDIFLDQQNLWVIDERLCFHTLITSDKKLNSIAGLESTSGKEPDILSFFYDTPIGVAEPGDLAGGGVVIIEFKRPGRDDYNKDPADQIIQRFVEISQGNVTSIDGRPINSQGLRYLGYLIADLTPSLRRHVKMRYHETVDGEGYFYTLPNGNGYIEIMSYDKLIQDSKRRNRILFDKLGLHKN
ncbi:MAG: ATP-binding protein [Alphaproteobacteria bacterium]